jgi:hypothetical protein
MAITYEPIATTTLAAINTVITFSTIPSTYTDLKLVLVSTGTASNQSRFLRINGDTATNYSYTYINGNGTTAASARATSTTNIDPTQAIGTSTTIPQIWTFELFSYAGSTNKSVLFSHIADNNGTGEILNGVGLWRSTSAITSLTIGMSGTGSMAIGTTATLYGILKA